MDGKESFSFLDGVPFTIGPKFCPPRDIPLPLAINYNLSPDLVVQKYDFDVENKVIEAARIRDEETKVKETLSSNEENENRNSSGIHKTPASHGASSWNSDSILQPQYQLQNKCLEFDSSTVPQNVKKINLSDFENDTTSPFDYMELQTINDLEELNTVFQGMHESHRDPAESSPALENSDLTSSSSVAASDPMQMNESQPINNVSKSVSFPLPQNFDFDGPNSQNSIVTNSNDAAVTSKVSNKDSENYLSYSFPNMPGTLNDVSSLPTHVNSLKRNSFHGENVSFITPALAQVPSFYNNQNVDYGYTAYYSSPNSNVPLRSSKSIPDLSNLSLQETATARNGRCQTPPANTIGYVPNMSSPKMAAVNANQSNIMNESSLSNNGASTRRRSLSDPYEELNELEKLIVDSICDMGFNRGQVSRTVKHLGTDQKKVVEHLCQIQGLEESGYDKLEAEAALHLHDYNKNEAIKFLDLLNQFQDLGFEKDAIKKALIQNKNDRDKVIDALLSSSSS